MGKNFALTMQLPMYRGRRQIQRKSASARSGLILVLSCAVLLVLHLVQINSFSTKGYEIKQRQREVTQLKEQAKKLEIQAAQLQSIQRVQGDQVILNMVPVTGVSYIQTTSLTQK